MVGLLAIASIFGLAFLSGSLGIYYLVASRRRERASGERLEEVGATPELVTRRRRSFLARWGESFDLSSKYAGQIQERLAQAAINLKPSEYVALAVALGIAVFFSGVVLIHLNPFLSLVVGIAAAWFLPQLYLRFRQNRYITNLNEQLSDVAMAMSNSLQAGLSIHQAMERVARDMPPPARNEFGQLVRELRFGANVEVAIRSMMKRLPSDELTAMTTVILVQLKVGGDLAKVLSEMAHTIAEREKLHAEIRTMTAEARYSSYIVPLLPVSILILMRNAMPTFIEPLFNHPIGWIILTLFGATQVLALLIIWRIADVKV